MSFTAQNQAAYDLFNRNCYHIPRNQRRYVWAKRNWQDLFDDIMLVYNGNEKTHFIGSIVLFCENERENGISYYTIIDGQQRIMTLAIFLSSLAFWLKCYSAENEFNGTKQYVVARDDSDKDHIMVTSEYHMSLERIVSEIIRCSVEEFKSMTIMTFLKKNTVSKKDKNIISAYNFFLTEIGEAIQESREDPVNFLVNLRDTIVNKILYVSIIATSEEDAYTIFEILNARGSALEDHELLKNFIMRGLLPEGDIDNAKILWGEIESELGSSIGQFVKHYATHRYRTDAHNGVSDYQTIRLANKGISTQALLSDICLKANYYCRLISPSCSGEDANCSPVEYMVYSFFKERRHEQIRPVLLSLIHQKELNTLSVDNYEKTILFLYDFFVCYNIIGQERSNKITNIVYSMAHELETNYSEAVLQDLISKLNNKLPTKESFISAFSLVGWSHHGGFYNDSKNKERVQIVLEALERYKSASGRCADFTIEHILDDNENERNGKIGNLIPLEEKLNKQCKGKSFEEKLTIYEQSNFITARNISSRYKSKVKFDIDIRTNCMAEEIYDRVLSFEIEYFKNKKNENEISQDVSENKADLSTRPVGEIVKKLESSKDEVSSHCQLSLFDEHS